ncbi:unnamed protein product [Effrenium voratum]|nr:unnamed protein product [Effrenium voratum]
MHRDDVHTQAYDPTAALAAAEVERLVQEHCNRLLEPTMEASKATAVQLEGLWDLSKTNSRKIINLDHTFREMQEGLLKIDGFRSELDKYETNLNKQVSNTEGLVERFEVQLAQVRMFTSQKEEAHLQHRSALDSLRHEVHHLQQKLDSCEEAFFRSLKEKLGEVVPLKAEMEAKLANMELRHTALSDEVWASESAIAKLGGELINVQNRFDQMKEVVDGLTDERDVREKLEKMQQELADWLGQSRFEAATIRKAFSAATAANKETIRIGLDVAANQTANFMDEVRVENQRLLQDTENLRGKTEVICQDFRSEISDMQQDRQRADARNEAILRELREGLEEYDRRRKREKTTLELEMKEVGQQLAILHDSVEDAVRACKSLEPLCGCLVEVIALQISLERQEFADWTRVSLVGYKPVAPFKNQEGDVTAKSSPKAQRSPRKKEDASQIISLDKRCYSCCSQTQMVLSGFKMACLNYKPSAVRTGESSFERLELFDRMALRQPMDQLVAVARERMKYSRDEEVIPMPERPEEATKGKSGFTLPALSPR